MCVHKPHLKVTALVTEVYGYYHYIGCVVYYKYVLCLCCASGLTFFKPLFFGLRWRMHATVISPVATVTQCSETVLSASHVTFYTLYMSISNYRLSSLMCMAYCCSMSLCYSKIYWRSFWRDFSCVHTVSLF